MKRDTTIVLLLLLLAWLKTKPRETVNSQVLLPSGGRYETREGNTYYIANDGTEYIQTMDGSYILTP